MSTATDSAAAGTSGDASLAPRMLKAILFDVDGTMADTDVFHRRVFKEILQPFGIECSDQFYNDHISGKENGHCTSSSYRSSARRTADAS